MSTVYDVKECCRCGGTAEYQFDVSSTEEVCFCPSCGYFQEWAFKRNADQSLFVDEANPHGVMSYREYGGHGIVCIMYGDGNAEYISLPTASYKKAKGLIRQAAQNKMVDIKDCFATVYDAKRHKVKTIYGDKPMKFQPNSPACTQAFCADAEEALPF